MPRACKRPSKHTFEDEKTEAVVEPHNMEITGQPLIEEGAHDHMEEGSAFSTSQEMVPIESDHHKPGENVEPTEAETSQSIAFARSELE